MARVIEIPVTRGDAAIGFHAREESRAGIRRLNVIRRRRQTVLDSPFDRPLEDRLVIVIHTEDEAAVDHDAEVVQPLDAQQRLHARYNHLSYRKRPQIAVVAVARELVGFLWAVMQDVPVAAVG